MILPAISHKTAKSACYIASRSILNIGFSEGYVNFLVSFCTSSKNEKTEEIKLPPEPQNCCLSGCANCVWVAYAQEVANILNDGGETAKKKIMENVKDPNLRAFLMLELQELNKKGK